MLQWKKWMAYAYIDISIYLYMHICIYIYTHIHIYFRLKCSLTNQEQDTIHTSLVTEFFLAANILHLCFTEIFYHRCTYLPSV